MKYGSGEVNKQDYANFVAASLAYLLIQQQDAVGMTLWDNEVRKSLPASANPAHLKLLLNEMAYTPSARKTQVEAVLHGVAESLTFAATAEPKTFFWSNGRAWGTFAQRPTRRGAHVELAVLHGRLRLRRLALAGLGGVELGRSRTISARRSVKLLVAAT